MRCNLGCGEFSAEGWLNVDIVRNDVVRPDLVADVRQLPLRRWSVGRLYAGHVLDHLAFSEARDAVSHWRELLTTRGRLLIVGADCRLASAMHRDGRLSQSEWLRIRYGSGRWRGDDHRWEASPELTAQLLESAGWYVVRISLPRMETDARVEWPIVSYARWQFALGAYP